MNSASAIFLGLCIAGFLALDAVVFDWDLSLALARRFAALLNWMAFWR
ncbi:hypothetical protein [Roseicyclus mahoneyensis]|uniref:Uncharacterized protein n=1 Tax=Roseicyclus mahoneyensis TaxID=164332 RepID=A0A316GNI7_9RHOB|nr:hypothetical protein [Roseicyclus mahoneyensis]PWK62218.1 hypothetical protein C7455_101244 [Roseicyclus mahoneyensis]